MKTQIRRKENSRPAPLKREHKPEQNKKDQPTTQEKPKKVWDPTALYF